MKLLCIVTHPPFEGSKVIEQLEAAMVAAVFDVEVSLLFLDMGVHCLVEGQAGERLNSRSPGKLISGLEMYDINQIYAEVSVLPAGTMVANVELIDKDAQKELLAQADIVIGGSA